MPSRVRIAVIGPGNASPAVLAQAEAVGAALAQCGAILICGGLGGAMAAAAQGARSAGGLTVGILPGDQATDANAFIDLPVPTGFGEARNLIVVRSAAAVIAVGGAYGTLSEIAFALKLGVPVVGLGTWQLQAPDGTRPPIVQAASAEEAARLALKAAGRRGS